MRFVRYPDLKTRFGINFHPVHIRRLEAAGKFPRRVHIGENSVGFLEAEILEWCEARVAERDAMLGVTPDTRESAAA